MSESDIKIENTALSLLDGGGGALALFTDDFVGNMGDDSVDVVFSGSRIPALSLLTTNSKLHSTHGFAPGTWAVGGPTPRPAAVDAEGAIVFVPAAIKSPRIRSVPADAAEDKGKVLCGALPMPDPANPKKRIEQAAAPRGVFSPSGKTLVPRIEETPKVGGKKGEKDRKFVGWSFPDDVECTSDCSKCLYGPGRDPKGGPSADRGFISKDAKFTVDGSRDGILEDLLVPDEFRKPSKTDCSRVIRCIGLVLCGEHSGMPAAWVPAVLTFRNSGYKAGDAAARTVASYAVGPKPAWAHMLRFGTEARDNDRFQWKAPTFLGVRQTSVSDGKGGTKVVAAPVPGPKAVAASLAPVDIQSMALALKNSIELQDWFGWFEDDVDGYLSAADDDASHMPGAEDDGTEKAY